MGFDKIKCQGQFLKVKQMVLREESQPTVMKDVDSFVSCFYVSTFNHWCREQILLLWQNVLDS